MSTIPPIIPPPASASFPATVKVFQTFLDQTQTIFAAHINEVHAEIVAIEKLIGAQPFVSLPYTTFAAALADLATNKAPANHQHNHSDLAGDATGDDHTQYVRVDGSRGFTGPVVVPNALTGGQLVNLGQLISLGYLTVAQANNIMNTALNRSIRGAAGGSGPLPGYAAPTTFGWTLLGGYVEGPTDASGNMSTTFSTGYPFTTCVQSFIATKVPVSGGHAQPAYNSLESQLSLVATTLTSATVRFSNDSGALANQWAAFSWICIGR